VKPRLVNPAMRLENLGRFHMGEPGEPWNAEGRQPPLQVPEVLSQRTSSETLVLQQKEHDFEENRSLADWLKPDKGGAGWHLFGAPRLHMNLRETFQVPHRLPLQGF